MLGHTWHFLGLDAIKNVVVEIHRGSQSLPIPVRRFRMMDAEITVEEQMATLSCYKPWWCMLCMLACLPMLQINTRVSAVPVQSTYVSRCFRFWQQSKLATCSTTLGTNPAAQPPRPGERAVRGPSLGLDIWTYGHRDGTTALVARGAQTSVQIVDQGGKGDLAGP
jgi:hypothetical protein